MIEIRDLYFTYPGNEQETIKGLDFQIKPGEVFGFLGPSGAGKSTTQKLIIGVLKGYQGEIRVLGQDLNQINSDFYENIGVSFEFPNLFEKFTALENLQFFRSLYRDKGEDPMELLTMVGLEDEANTRVKEFSKGMKMRLNFCRAYLNKPELLFLDEPTSGLDPVNARKVKEIIRNSKNKGKTIFLTTHNMTVAEDLCDRVAFIVDGQINLIDSPRELMIKYSRKTVKIEYRLSDKLKEKEFPLQGIGVNQEFFELLQNRKIETIHSQEATLEDIFIDVTGRSLQ